MANVHGAGLEAQLQIALDNMPGALVYTDERLHIVFCNDQFKTMYPAPQDLLQPGRPYPAFLRHLAENGYYGKGEIDALVGQRVESLRNPTGKSFEDRSPDGRWYRILRCRAASGGTVTVMTDVTEHKRAEQALAAKEAQLLVALDNMPGALVYTDEDLSIVFCNDRFREMYGVPAELLQPGRPYPAFLRYLAENGYYGDGDVEALVERRVASLRNPSDKMASASWYLLTPRESGSMTSPKSMFLNFFAVSPFGTVRKRSVPNSLRTASFPLSKLLSALRSSFENFLFSQMYSSCNFRPTGGNLRSPAVIGA